MTKLVQTSTVSVTSNLNNVIISNSIFETFVTKTLLLKS